MSNQNNEDIVDRINKQWREYQEKKQKLQNMAVTRIENHLAGLRRKARFESMQRGNAHP